jgi:stage II sporulation protein D
VSPRTAATALAALAVTFACTAGEPAGPSPGATIATTGPPGTTAPASPSVAPVTSTRVAPGSGGTLLVRGTYPRVDGRCVDPEQPKLLARYPGALRVHREEGGLTITVTLPFDRYLEGIAEVPPTWPAPALEAQAIAARSYALATTGWDGDDGEALDEPICASSSCQVYRGIPVPRDPTHRRWVRAVRRTDGLVLLHGGRPATTVYFSTSNGRTYGNETVFGSDPLPYLRPVVERDDGASGTSRWTVRLPFRHLARLLAADERWPRGRALSGVRLRGDAVVLEGAGARRSVALDDLRDAANTWGPCLLPRRYPGDLPLTIPSRWLSASVADGTLVVRGRGWGHGVGMVQWGAYGKARRGLDASTILAYYYGGLEPEPFPEPGTIRVVVARGLTGISIVPSGPGARIDGEPFVGGRVRIASGDEGLRIEP